MNFFHHYQKLKFFYNHYERWLMPIMLVVGFLADYITFVNIEINTALVVLFIYWIICALVISFVYAFDAGKISERFKTARLFAPLIIQFTFGGLLSNSFIFYWFSGSVWVSWPFILAFVIIMVSNDALRHHFLKPMVQLSVFYFCTFSMFSVALPFWFSSLNPRLFVFAGIFSLIYIIWFSFVIKYIVGVYPFNWKTTSSVIFGIYTTINGFYFLNLIPPIPLGVRETGIYHYISRNGGQYILSGEKESFLEKIIPGKILHLAPGERAYIYTAIFAPKELRTEIIHEWQYFDAKKKEWIIKDELSFNLAGGRKEGFRGYSYKTVLPEGKWRVFVKTPRGQVLNRQKFQIKKVKDSVDLINVVR